ncbi:hypothetical protein THAOC_27393, partial [Thalassiosira oceanica]
SSPQHALHVDRYRLILHALMSYYYRGSGSKASSQTVHKDYLTAIRDRL